MVADALSRWAYPATSARDDVSFHGSAAASEEVKRMAEEEKALANVMVTLVREKATVTSAAVLWPDGGRTPRHLRY